jgi:hypothetical protein
MTIGFYHFECCAFSFQFVFTSVLSTVRCKKLSTSQWRVALLGITQRQIQVKYPANLGNQKRSKVLKLNVKTAGDWLKVKRIEKNLTLGHVAAKMGIATS